MLIYRAPRHIQEVSPASCYSTAVYLVTVLLIKLFACSVVAVELASLSCCPYFLFSQSLHRVFWLLRHHFSSFHITIFPSGVNNYSQPVTAALITALPRYRKMYEEAEERTNKQP